MSDAELLALNNYQRVWIAIDGASPASVKQQQTIELRGILSNAIRFKHMMMRTNKKAELVVTFTVSRANVGQIADVARLARVLQADMLVVTEQILGPGNAHRPDGVWDLTDEEAATLVKSLSEAYTLLSGTPTAINIRPAFADKLQPILAALNEQRPVSAAPLRAAEDAELGLGPCFQPWQNVIVLANGDVRTCLGQSYALGNMLDQPVIDIINGPAARNVRAKILNGESDLPCKSCSAAQPLAPDAFAAYLTNLIEQYDAARGLVAAR